MGIVELAALEDLLKCGGEGFGSQFDGIGGVGRGEEASFELGGREVDAFFEASVEEASEGGGIGLLSGFEVVDGAWVEVEAEHGADAVEGEGFLVEDGAEGIFELGADGLEGLPCVGLLEVEELSDASGEGEGVAGEGSGLINGAVGGEEVHNFCFAAEGTDGEASADDFAKGGEVGGDVVEGLSAAGVDAEAGHDFIEDEEGFVVGAERTEFVEEVGVWEVETCVCWDGFEDDGGGLGAEVMEVSLQGLDVVEGEGRGECSKFGGDAGAVGLAEGEGAAAGFDEEGIYVSVVTAVELEDAGAVGESAGEADAGHGGFGAGVDESDFFERGDVFAEDLRHLDFGGVGGAEAKSVTGGGAYGIEDGLGGVAEDSWAPGADVIEELAAIGGKEVGAFGGLGKEGLSAYGAEGADGGIDPARDEFLGNREEFSRWHGGVRWELGGFFPSYG